MSKVYFVADTHFSDEAIRLYENRPYIDTYEMDKALVDNWNLVVSPDDIIWHLGDFGAEGHEAEMLSKLNGNVFLVKGNHDTKSNEYYRQAGFCEVYDKPILYEGFWLLSHEPLYVNTNMPYANLFGHVHANPIYKDLGSQHVCVCVERINYTPIPFDEIKRQIASNINARKQ